jgi:hypothetical protein
MQCTSRCGSASLAGQGLLNSNEGRRIAVTRTRTSVETLGAIETVGVELRLDVRDESNISDAENLLEHLVRHFISSPRRLSPGQTVDWASSLLVARKASPRHIAFGEMDLDGRTIIPAVDRAVTIWTEQSKMCVEHHASFCPTRFSQMIMVSPRVLNGVQRLEGIRYAPTTTLSGWWVFTEDYDGTKDEFKSMRPTHVFEFLRHRLDLSKYLGLSNGFAFRSFAPETVWFEHVD